MSALHADGLIGAVAHEHSFAAAALDRDFACFLSIDVNVHGQG